MTLGQLGKLAFAARVVARLIELQNDPQERAHVVALMTERMRRTALDYLRANKELIPPEVYARLMSELEP